MRIFHWAIFVLIFGLNSNLAHASAKVTIDSKAKTVTLESHLYFYTPITDSERVAKTVKLATDEINQYWNGGAHPDSSILPLTATINDDAYVFQVKVTSEIISEEIAAQMMMANPKEEENFIRLLEGNLAKGDRSQMDDICGYTGTWYLTDDLGNSTTAAHEFGHGLCLDHPKENWIGRGQPPIMAARGMLVDPPFQYDPKAEPGAVGGTLKPYLRRVTQYDVDQIPLSQILYDNGVGYISKEALFRARLMKMMVSI